MLLVIKALLSMAVAIAAVVVVTSLTGTFADVLAGVVAVVATLLFTRAIMDFAAEPGEDRQRSDRPR